jgi:hypothetical protein
MAATFSCMADACPRAGANEEWTGRHRARRFRGPFPCPQPAGSQSNSSPLKRTMQLAAYPVAAASETFRPRCRHTVWTETAQSWPSRLSGSTAPRRPASAQVHQRRLARPGDSLRMVRCRTAASAEQDAGAIPRAQSGFAVKCVNSRAVVDLKDRTFATARVSRLAQTCRRRLPTGAWWPLRNPRQCGGPPPCLSEPVPVSGWTLLIQATARQPR